MTEAEFYQQVARQTSAGFPVQLPRGPEKPVDDSNELGIIDDARAMLSDALVAERLTRAFRQGDLDSGSRLRVLTRLVASGVGELGRLAQSLIAGALSLGRWFRSMWFGLTARDYAAAMANLQTDRPLPADLKTIRREVNGQVGFLERFRDSIQNGTQLLGEGIVNRAGLYAHAAWGVAERVTLAASIRNGYAEARRVLGVADHCHDCLAQAALGWMDISAIVPIGQTACGPRCHCYMEVR